MTADQQGPQGATKWESGSLGTFISSATSGLSVQGRINFRENSVQASSLLGVYQYIQASGVGSPVVTIVSTCLSPSLCLQSYSDSFQFTGGFFLSP